MGFPIETLTTRVEQLFKSLLLLFFGVHYGLIPVLSRTAALLMLATSIIVLSGLRFTYYRNTALQNTTTSNSLATKLATADALLILTVGIGFISVASYSIFNSQTIISIGFGLISLGFLFFGLKRHYFVDLYGVHPQAVPNSS